MPGKGHSPEQILYKLIVKIPGFEQPGGCITRTSSAAGSVFELQVFSFQCGDQYLHVSITENPEVSSEV